MKRQVVRVALSFAGMPKDQLNSMVILAIVCITKNAALFPTSR